MFLLQHAPAVAAHGAIVVLTMRHKLRLDPLPQFVTLLYFRCLKEPEFR